ncbi:hypothetical protein V8B97DRAFT_1975567 [Scleroderma yunnanense]
MSTAAPDAVPSDSPTPPYYAVECFPRRIRHITGVQIVNLTPFPVRDAFATAISQPASLSQFTPLGNFSDDLDLTLLRKRSRRISSTSVNTSKNLVTDDFVGSPDEAKATTEGKGRRKVQTRPTWSSGAIPAPGSVPENASTHPAATLHFDHTQRTLEKVVQSRLVETFITITVPEPPLPPSPAPPNTSAHARSRTQSGSTPLSVSPGHIPTPSKVSRISRSASIGGTKGLSNRIGAPAALPSPTTRKTPPTSKASSSSSSRKLVRTHKQSSSVPLQRSKSQQSPFLSTDTGPQHVPNYISSVHRPSTNPIFPIDPSSNEFAPHTNLSADKVKIELWARNGERGPPMDVKGKQKEVPETANLSPASEWKRLNEWSVTMSDLVPLLNELEDRQSYLPSNTLVMTFSTSDHCFYLPSTLQPPFRAPSLSRSTSPSGYNTDPETEIRRFDRVTPSVATDSIHASDSYSRLSLSRRARRTTAKTASSQQLFHLATLQACILDTEESLRILIKETEALLGSCDATILSREASEREVRIQDRQADKRDIVEQMKFLQDDIAFRRQRLQARRENLALEQAQYAAAVAALAGNAAEVTERRSSLTALRNRITPIRTSLVSVLSAIYPIDLTSPSDLLYSVLGVPLPIPLNGNEPAPPLSLPFHKEVTEDAVATALGYAAHLVQLLAVYMGKGLVYPVTYVSSRSLIKDNISTMVGPRMFPLFSKGVDTYRFEYAVFLLNKDIEMLMAERDLRALDMRHTLPNLKNLLLTLTDGECANICHPRIQDSPSTSGLATPPRSPSPDHPRSSSNTPKAGRSPYVAPTELPPESGSSSLGGGETPTVTPAEVATTSSRYPKLMLALPPFPGFLRSRNVSSVRSATKPAFEQSEEDSSSALGVATGPLESGQSARPNGGEDDDDRQTIKGMDILRRGQPVEGKAVNVHVPHRDSTTQEKFCDGSSLTTSSSAIHVESGHQ